MSQACLLQVVYERFKSHAEATAVITLDGLNSVETSYDELWVLATYYCPFIEKYYKRNQVVPLFLTRSIDCLALMLACVITERVFSVLNSRVQVRQLEHVLQQTNAQVLWIDGPAVMALKKADPEQIQRLSHITMIVLKTESWLPLHDKQVSRLQGRLSINFLTSSELTSEYVQAAPKYNSARPAACLFTSGSTGNPKGVLVSSADLLARANAEIQSFGLVLGDRLLSILPWSFDVGLSQVLTSWVNGCPLVLLNSWLPADIINTTKRYAITGISAVPSIWIDLLASGLTFEEPLPKYATISGGSLGSQNQTDLTQQLKGIQLIKTYGQTETCRSAIAFAEDIAVAPESVGRAYTGSRIYIVDENLRLLPTGEIGEVLHTGDGVMLGYLEGESKSKLVKNPFYNPLIDNSRFAVRTGDSGRMDNSGRLYLHGRSDDMIKIQGNRVYLAEVAAEAEALSEVLEALAVAITSDELSEIVLFASATSANPTLNEVGLRKRLLSRLPSYMLPKHIEVLERFPRTANGKPDRQKLMKIAIGYQDKGV